MKSRHRLFGFCLGLLAGISSLVAQIEVTSTGVGIGTVTPAKTLEVVGPALSSPLWQSEVLRVTAGHSAGLGIDAGSSHWGVSLFQDGTKIFTVDSNAGALIGGNYVHLDAPANGLAVEGNVGLGTSSPTAKLHINDAGSVLRFGHNLSPGSMGPALMLETASNVYSDVVWNTFGVNQVRLRGSSYGLAIGGSQPRLNIGFSDGNFTAALVVNGNVGVGTTTPSATFEVKSSNSTGLISRAAVSKTDTTSRRLLLLTSDDSVGATNLELDFRMQGGAAPANRFLQMQATDNGYGYTALVLNPLGGNVGVGTTSPSHRLTVAGPVRASSFVADVNTYADFVFKPDYRLAPLTEVEAHIAEKGHLPGIPSEAEARENGIDVVEMQVKLLQKIEEITLHQIAQQKELAALKAENAALREALLAR